MGNNNTLSFYSFTDSKSNDKTAYYQLKQTDFDNKFEYSNIIAIENCVNDLTELTISQNPTYNKIEVVGLNHGIIEILNVQG